MIKKYSFDIFKPEWPKWKVRIADALLNSVTYLGVARANRLLRKYSHLKNHVFINQVLKEVELELDLVGLENIPEHGPVTIVANHPGGADVMATISALGERRPDISILANELICVEPVVDIVIPVNLMKRTDKVDMGQVHQAYRDGRVVVFYAAGKNSRFNENGELRDRKWRTTYLDFAMEYNTPIIVLNVGGANSSTFYKVSNIRQKYKWLRKVPLENIFQLRELLKSKGLVKLMFSEPITIDYLKGRIKNDDIKSKRQLADEMHSFLYEMNEDQLKFNR